MPNHIGLLGLIEYISNNPTTRNAFNFFNNEINQNYKLSKQR